jgi:uncharacterized protein GlcG (DUF336 family)
LILSCHGDSGIEKERSMYQKGSIGLEEAQGAIQAMLEEVKGHPEKYWQHGAMAVVDERGKLVAFAKMDSPHQLPGDVAIRKAWTAAICAQDNHQADAMLKKGGALLEEFCSGGTSIPGGVTIFAPSEELSPTDPGTAIPPFKTTCIGAIGVGGVGLPTEDLAVARVGLEYIRKKIWPETH